MIAGETESIIEQNREAFDDFLGLGKNRKTRTPRSSDRAERRQARKAERQSRRETRKAEKQGQLPTNKLDQIQQLDDTVRGGLDTISNVSDTLQETKAAFGRQPMNPNIQQQIRRASTDFDLSGGVGNEAAPRPPGANPSPNKELLILAGIGIVVVGYLWYRNREAAAQSVSA